LPGSQYRILAEIFIYEKIKNYYQGNSDVTTRVHKIGGKGKSFKKMNNTRLETLLHVTYRCSNTASWHTVLSRSNEHRFLYSRYMRWCWCLRSHVSFVTTAGLFKMTLKL